jgi:hypothetical protein
MRQDWMRDLRVGQEVKSLLSQRVLTITGIDWGTLRVHLKSKYDSTEDISLMRLYEYYSYR